MNELLPYELELNQQWIDLPLPNENMAWADMKRRLDDEDKRRVIPFWLTGCAGWGLLGVLVLGLAWWIVRPERWFTNKQGTEKTDTLTTGKSKTENDTTFNRNDTGTTQAFDNKDSAERNNIKGSIVQPDEKDSSGLTIETISPQTKKIKNSSTNDNSQFTAGQKIPVKKKKQPVKSDQQKPGKKKEPTDTNVPDKTILDKVKQNELPKDSIVTIVKNEKPKKDPVTDIVKTNPVIDTIQQKPKDTTTKKPDESLVVQDKKPKKDSSKKRAIIFSAGLGLHQQLPVAGQTFVPYSALGRKGSLADYIPAVYFRVEKENKWFIQTGFRYGAPQLVKEFQYGHTADTVSSQKYNTTETYLKKTFYHQLPLTVNYFIAPNLSVGAGIVWNKFSSAVSSQDMIQHDRFGGNDTALSTGAILTSRKADSNFVNSYFQASIEAQYKWKRFSFGANYSFGLQPYIRFVLPGGALQEEKNKSLNVFIRYELWRSKKK